MSTSRPPVARRARLFAGLLILGGLAAAMTGCGHHEDVSLRRFPYPYRAALAICSDIDGTESLEKFLAIQRFLDTADSTAVGPGVDLEIGNSFWFYNQCEDVRGKGAADSLALNARISGGLSFEITLFKGTSDTLNDYAPLLLKLIRSGYLDCLHTYGNLDKHRLNRSMVTQALDLLAAESLTVRTWTNHGGHENTQNIGPAPWFQGDNPGSPDYHTDRTLAEGIIFLWRGHVTHCIGQDGDFSLLNTAKSWYEYLQDKFRIHQGYPHDNRLVHVYRLDDGQKVFEFVRFISPTGKYAKAEGRHFADQLGPGQVNDLIDNRGYLILYTHLGITDSPDYLDNRTVAALRYIAAHHADSELFVTTTTRLLDYYVHRKYLFWHYNESPDSVLIVIDSVANEVEGTFLPSPQDLAGITFYVPANKVVTVEQSDRKLNVVENPPDETGRRSVSFPWPKLTFPEEILSQ